MERYLILRLDKHLIAIPDDVIDKVSRIKEGISLTPKLMSAWNVVSISSHLGIQELFENRKVIVFFKNSPLRLIFDAAVKYTKLSANKDSFDNFNKYELSDEEDVFLLNPLKLEEFRQDGNEESSSFEVYQQQDPELLKKYQIVTLDEHLVKSGFTPSDKQGFLCLKSILSEEEMQVLGKGDEIKAPALEAGSDDVETLPEEMETEKEAYDEGRSYALDDLDPDDDVYVEVDDVSIEGSKDFGENIYVEVDNPAGDSNEENENEFDLPVSDYEKQDKKKIESPIDETFNKTKSYNDDLLKDAFFQTAKDTTTESAFSDAFKIASDEKLIKESNSDIPNDEERQGDAKNGEDDFDFLESNASYDYDGIVPKKKRPVVSDNTSEIVFGEEKQVEDKSAVFDDEPLEEADDKRNGKKSYIQRRDDEIELIRQEILKAKEGLEDKSDIDLIKNILKKEKTKLDKTAKAKEIKPVKKGNGKKKRKKRRSLESLAREIIFSAGFKITVILLGIFAFSILGIFFIERNSQGGMFKSIWDSLWYTIVTFTTVGYGDKYPVTFSGQIVGIFMMFVGVTLFGVVSGRIASYLVDLQIKRGKGLIKLQKLSKHFVVCGWRKDFNLILDDILAANKDISNDEMVLINDVSLEMMEAIMSDERYRGINYIRGDFLDESVLRRANIAKAQKVLILADSSHEYSPQEADSRTVMAAITIESINKDVYVCAELLDGKFERYLKLAHVEEIILTREYSRTLLANASAANGMSHIVTELISTMSEKGITVDDIPREFIGDTYESLAMFYLDRDGSILIGLLENTGNFYARKKEALQEAQKTPDISKLVTNLKVVKSLTANKPVVNPGGDYVIKEHSKAIIVDGVNRSEKEAIFG